MITNVGKEILSKYLIGQAPSYASYVAIGCGPKPVADLSFAITNKQAEGNVAILTIPGHKFLAGQEISVRDVDPRINGHLSIVSITNNTVSVVYAGESIPSTPVTPNGIAMYNFANKTALDFEMFRVPITSRGFVNDSGVSKIVFTAELPTDERYEISEVGIFSSGTNPTAGAYDSRSLYAFTTDENWEHHTNTAAVELPVIYAPLDGENNDNNIDQTYKVFQTNSDNRIFTDENRLARYERARFFNNIVALRGDTSDLQVIGEHIVPQTGSEHIHLTGTSLDFSKNSPIDEIKLAFSLINKDASSDFVPDEVRILLEFSSTDVYGEGEWARFEFVANADDYDFENNRYIVATKQLQELHKSQDGFTWNSISVIKIYATVIKNGVKSSDYYVGLDAIRFENVASYNPVYGLTGYTVIKNQTAETIVKAANTTNFIEFRFAMDVL